MKKDSEKKSKSMTLYNFFYQYRSMIPNELPYYLCQNCEENKEENASFITKIKEKDTKWNMLINSPHKNLAKSSKVKFDLENETLGFSLKNVKYQIGQELTLKKGDHND